MKKNFKSSPTYKAMTEAAQHLQLLQFDWLASADGRLRKSQMEQRRSAHPRIPTSVFTEKVKLIPDQGFIIKDPTLFIDVSKADKVQRKALTKWLTGQTCPKIPGVELACYPHDYNRFVEAFYRGETAEILD